MSVAQEKKYFCYPEEIRARWTVEQLKKSRANGVLFLV